MSAPGAPGTSALVVEALGRVPSVFELPPSGPPPPELEDRIDEIWERERTRRGERLFAGRIFSLTRREGSEFHGRFVDYRLWLAQLRDPSLRPSLGLRPLSVSGLLRLPAGLVIGRRAMHVTQAPGDWELVPSGGLDEGARGGDGRLDPLRQVLLELEEELNLRPPALQGLRPIALIEDPDSAVCDLSFEMTLDLSTEDLLEAFAARGNDEYTELKVVGADRIAFGPRLSRASRAVIEMAGFTPTQQGN